MKEKELRRLSRAELLELLLAQTKETERLQLRLNEAETLLAERHLKLMEAGDLAHAVLAVNHVMEAAQAAAKQYLDNIAAMEAAAKKKCEQLIREATRDAELIRSSAGNAVKEQKLPEEPVQELLAQLHNLLDGENNEPGEQG